MERKKTMLSLHSISKRYADKSALNDVSFDVGQGEIVALLGANGSGKTTTIQAICGLVSFDSGDITFCDISIRKNRDYLGRVGAVLDGSRNVNWRLTVAQNATYFARLKGVKLSNINQTIAALEERLGLAQYRGKEVMKLSTGNRQKAALLCSLIHSPQLLLLDEPTLGLDLQTVSDLRKIIESQVSEHQQGFLITSHDMAFIDGICNKVVVLDAGKVIFNGTIETLKNNLYKYELTMLCPLEYLMEIQNNAEAFVKGNNELSVDESVLSIRYNEVEQVLPVLSWLERQRWHPETLEIRELNIEKAYRSLIKEEVKS